MTSSRELLEPVFGRDHCPLVLLLDVDPILAALYKQWLRDAGFEAVPVGKHEVVSAELAERSAVALVDLPFPRRGGSRLRQHSRAMHNKPLIVVSGTFHAGLPSYGAVALSLGVFAVLPSPVLQETLVGVVSEAIVRAA